MNKALLFVICSSICLSLAAEISGYVYTKIPWGDGFYAQQLGNAYVGTGLDSTLSSVLGPYHLSYTPVSSSSSTVANRQTPLSNSQPILVDANGRHREFQMQGRLRLYPLGDQVSSISTQNANREVQQGILFYSSGFLPQTFDYDKVPDTVWLQRDWNSLSVQYWQAYENFDSLRLYSFEKSFAQEHLDTNGIGELLGQQFLLLGDTIVRYYFYQNQKVVDSMFLGIDPFNSIKPHSNEMWQNESNNMPRSSSIAVIRDELSRLYRLYDRKFRDCVANIGFRNLCPWREVGMGFYYSNHFSQSSSMTGHISFALIGDYGYCKNGVQFSIIYDLLPDSTLKQSFYSSASPECLQELHF